MYRTVSRSGDPILINVEPFDLDDSMQEDAEIRIVAAGLCNGRAGGSSGVRAEYINTWLCGMIKEEEKGKENTGDL